MFLIDISPHRKRRRKKDQDLVVQCRDQRRDQIVFQVLPRNSYDMIWSKSMVCIKLLNFGKYLKIQKMKNNKLYIYIS